MQLSRTNRSAYIPIDLYIYNIYTKMINIYVYIYIYIYGPKIQGPRSVRAYRPWSNTAHHLARALRRGEGDVTTQSPCFLERNVWVLGRSRRKRRPWWTCDGHMSTHHSRFNVTCECNKEGIDDDDDDMSTRSVWKEAVESNTVCQPPCEVVWRKKVV